MTHFVIFALRGLFVIWMLKSTTNALEIKGHLPNASVINSFLENFVKPYMRNIFIKANKPIARAAVNEATVQATIENKIVELKPLLQDADEKIDTEENLTLESKDETTIIEFLPRIGPTGEIDVGTKDIKPDSFRAHIKEYKKMSRKIKEMLRKENISNNTRDTVVNTLDKVIATLIESQCTWKPDGHDSAMRNDQLHRSISRVRRLSNEQWSKLRRHYEGFLQTKLMQEDSFLDMFHEFFSKVVNDSQSLSKRYRIRCQLIEVEDEKPSIPRYKAFAEKSTCENFKLCSDELKEFMTDFYIHLNDTAVSTFKNYAAMYIRDVNMDVDLDKDTVVAIINAIGDSAERKVIKVFKKQTNKIELDQKKDRIANIKHMGDYIQSSIEHVKKHLKKLTEKNLKSLRTKLYLSIREDLDVNTDVDLGNLERLFMDRICTVFVLCNGRYSTRRRNLKDKNLKDNNINVRVQLTLDDELKQSLGQRKPSLINFIKDTIGLEGSLRKTYTRNTDNNLTVTRTTILNNDHLNNFTVNRTTVSAVPTIVSTKSIILSNTTIVVSSVKEFDSSINEV